MKATYLKTHLGNEILLVGHEEESIHGPNCVLIKGQLLTDSELTALTEQAKLDALKQATMQLDFGDREPTLDERRAYYQGRKHGEANLEDRVDEAERRGFEAGHHYGHLNMARGTEVSEDFIDWKRRGE